MNFCYFLLFLVLGCSCAVIRSSQGPSTSGNLPETTQIGLAALQQKALKQQEQLERTALGFRFPLQMSPLLTRAELYPRRTHRRVWIDYDVYCFNELNIVFSFVSFLIISIFHKLGYVVGFHLQ